MLECEPVTYLYKTEVLKNVMLPIGALLFFKQCPIKYQYFSLGYQPIPISIRYHHATDGIYLHYILFEVLEKAALSDLIRK